MTCLDALLPDREAVLNQGAYWQSALSFSGLHKQASRLSLGIEPATNHANHLSEHFRKNTYLHMISVPHENYLRSEFEIISRSLRANRG